MLSGLFLLSARLSAHNAYLSDVAESIDVWHRGGIVGGHNYFPRLLVELHTELFQAQGFGFRGSAWVQRKETTQGEYYITTLCTAFITHSIWEATAENFAQELWELSKVWWIPHRERSPSVSNCLSSIQLRALQKQYGSLTAKLYCQELPNNKESAALHDESSFTLTIKKKFWIHSNYCWNKDWKMTWTL